MPKKKDNLKIDFDENDPDKCLLEIAKKAKRNSSIKNEIKVLKIAVFAFVKATLEKSKEIQHPIQTDLNDIQGNVELVKTDFNELEDIKNVANFFLKRNNSEKLKNGLKIILARALSDIKMINEPQTAIDCLNDVPIISEIIFTKLFYEYLVQNNTERVDRNSSTQNSSDENAYPQDKIEWQYRRFDSLSRLIALDSQCSAACYLEEQSQILFAFNEVHKKNKNTKYENHVNNVMKYLKACANKSLDFEEKNELRLEILINACKSHKDISRSINKNDIKEKIEVLDRLKPIDRDQTMKDPISNVIRRLHRDLEKLTDAVTPLKDSQKIFNDEIITAIKESNFEFIKEGLDENKFHAEMRILTYILNLNKNIDIYIGLSKLCCAHCHLIVGRESLTIALDDNEFTINTSNRGYHKQSFEWLCAKYFGDQSVLMKKILGENAYKIYEKANANIKDNFLEIVETIGLSKKSELVAQGINVTPHPHGQNKTQISDMSVSLENFKFKPIINEIEIQNHCRSLFALLQNAKGKQLSETTLQDIGLLQKIFKSFLPDRVVTKPLKRERPVLELSDEENLEPPSKRFNAIINKEDLKGDEDSIDTLRNSGTFSIFNDDISISDVENDRKSFKDETSEEISNDDRSTDEENDRSSSRSEDSGIDISSANSNHKQSKKSWANNYTKLYPKKNRAENIENTLKNSEDYKIKTTGANQR